MLQLHTDMRIVHLDSAIEEGIITGRRNLLVRQDGVDRINHVIGGQLVAVMEGDVPAQREFQCFLISPFVSIRQAMA